MLQESLGENMPVVFVNNNHIELTTTFSTGGTAVNVTDPTFELFADSLTGATVAIPPTSLLVPFSKNGAGVGNYRVTFLADDWLSDGSYYGVMSGTYSGSTIESIGLLTAKSSSGVQGLIELVRSALHDYAGTLYVIDDPDEFLFPDGQIYGALGRSLDKINYTKPADYTFTLTGCPWTGLLIDGAVIYALHQRGILEVANTFSYNDEISFTIDRASKYLSMLQVFASTWETNVGRVKLQYAFTRASFIGMGQTHLPYSTTQIFSMIPQVAGILSFGGGLWR